jgi:diguanylate cyclase (GGDEF)-like protein
MDDVPLLRTRNGWWERCGQRPDNRDLLLIGALCVLVAGLEIAFALFERVVAVISRHDNLQLDALATVLLALPFLLSGFTLRRWLELRREVRRRQDLEAELQHQAFYDTLTGLPNRALFLDRLGHALARTRRVDEGLAVLFLDLDDFKLVNDSLGHAAGDELLRGVAQRLSTSLRPGDTAARFGGDEFTVLLEQVADATEAAAIAERLRVALAVPLSVAGRSLVAGVSVGLAGSFVGEDAATASALLQAADLALYQAKAAGKGQLVVFDDSMQRRATARLELVHALRQAVAHEDFVVYYQPQIDTASGQLVGVEALVRWQHPERGLVEPVDFIGLAEETGLILPLGLWVLRMACRQAQSWRAQNDGRPLLLSVNLSPMQVRQPDLVAEVAAILAETGLPADALCLEITESVLLEDAEATTRTLQALRALGVHLAIDDFGTGYASLSYLQRFPVETVKIDRSFIAALGESAGGMAIVEAVTALAHQLGLAVVAEGIETAAQSALVEQVGCDQSQGFYVAHPLPAEELVRLFASSLTAAGASDMTAA